MASMAFHESRSAGIDYSTHDSNPIASSVGLLHSQHLASPAFLEEWCSLANDTSGPNPFYEHWNLRPAIEHLAGEGEIEVFAYRESGNLLGLLPVARSKNYYGRAIAHWTSWLHDNCFCGTPLVRSGSEMAFWRAILAEIDRKSGGFFLHLPKLAADNPVTQALFRVLREKGCMATIVCREERAMLASELSPSEYFGAAITAKKRKELRRQVKRLGELGELKVERLCGVEGLDQWIDEFVALEHAGWKGEERSSLASHAPIERYFRAAVQGGAAENRIERLSLSLDGTPVAMLVTFLAAPGSFSFKTAYNEQFSKFSPGVLLQQENLALLDRSDIAWCDSCAASDHPMIDHIWREKRTILGVNIALGGPLKRTAFRLMSRLERGTEPCNMET